MVLPNALVVLAGLPGTGKTTLARKLLAVRPGSSISSDAVRAELYEAATYSANESMQVYEEIARRLTKSLQLVDLTVVDATNFSRPGVSRQLIGRIELLGSTASRVVKVLLTTRSDVLRSRLAQRQASLRSADDSSEADEVVATRLADSSPGPGWWCIDTTDCEVEDVAHAILLELDGENPQDLAPRVALSVREVVELSKCVNLSNQADSERRVTIGLSLHELGQALATGAAVLDERHQRCLNVIFAQIDRDSLDPRVLQLWGDSTLIDENTGTLILPEGIAKTLHDRAGLDYEFPVGNAGILHTYGYLLSAIWTPYGWKRSRWISGTMARILSLPADFLDAEPASGTLLRNLSAVAGRIAGIVTPFLVNPWQETEPEWTVTKKNDVAVSVASGEETIFRTLIARGVFDVASGMAAVLVYTIECAGRHQLITMFPITSDYADTLIAETAAAGEFMPKYNAVVRGIAHWRRL